MKKKISLFSKKNKFFYKDKNDELLFLSKINNLVFFYDEKNNFQKVNSNFEIFNIPFKLDISKILLNKKKILN